MRLHLRFCRVGNEQPDSGEIISLTRTDLSRAIMNGNRHHEALPRINSFPMEPRTARMLSSAFQPPDDEPQFSTELATWLEQAPAHERDAREAASLQIREAYESAVDEIWLRDITSLPACMVRLRTLKKLMLTSIGPRMPHLGALPPALEELQATRLGLQDLPPLPASIRIINLEHNGLRHVPAWPSSLSSLHISYNDLQDLAESVLPDSLVELSAAHTGLRTVPNLPPNFLYLDVRDNFLRELPELPQTLYRLEAEGNLLEELPMLPTSLYEISVARNQLTDFPESLLSAPDLTTANFEDNPISTENVQRFAEQLEACNAGREHQLRLQVRDHEARAMSASPAFGAFVTIPTPNAWSEASGFPCTGRTDRFADTDSPAHGLTNAVLQWYWEGRDDCAEIDERKQQWAEAQAEAADPARSGAAASFVKFLARLKETEEYRDDATYPHFVCRVTRLIDELSGAGASGLREHAFAVAADALGECGDRIALGLDNMEVAILTFQAKHGTLGKDELVGLGTGIIKLGLLSEICEEKIKANPGVDDIELHLAYRTQLADELGLPVMTRKARYLATANLQAADLELAKARIDGKMNDPVWLAQALASWEPWQAFLDRNPCTELADAQKNLFLEKQRLQDETANLMHLLAENQRRHGELSNEYLQTVANINQVQQRFNMLDDRFLATARIINTIYHLQDQRQQ